MHATITPSTFSGGNVTGTPNVIERRPCQPRMRHSGAALFESELMSCTS